MEMEIISTQTEIIKARQRIALMQFVERVQRAVPYEIRPSAVAYAENAHTIVIPYVGVTIQSFGDALGVAQIQMPDRFVEHPGEIVYLNVSDVYDDLKWLKRMTREWYDLGVWSPRT